MLDITLWNINRIKPYERNARKIPKKAIDKVAESLKKYGWRQPIVVDKKGIIVVGHVRLLAAQKNGEKEVPVHVAKDLSANEIRLYRLADNRTHDETTWDLDILALEMGDLEAIGAELVGSFFDSHELAKFRADAEPGAEPPAQFEKAAALVKKYKVKRGMVWRIGSHRLMCGDATDANDVELLMAGAKANLVATDPPYGVDYSKTKNGMPVSGFCNQSERWGDIEADDLAGPKLQEFLEKVFALAAAHASDNAAWYLWHAHLTQGTFAAAAAKAAGIIIHRQIIWVKPSLVLTRSGMYHRRHEPCYYGWKKGHTPPWYGDKTQTTVWALGRDVDAGHHPTQKPVECFAIPIRNHLKKGQVSYEPFVGSGSQMIAAEQAGTKCFAMDIEPRYVAVVLDRMAAMGLKAEQISASPLDIAKVHTQRQGKSVAATLILPENKKLPKGITGLNPTTILLDDPEAPGRRAAHGRAVVNAANQVGRKKVAAVRRQKAAAGKRGSK